LIQNSCLAGRQAKFKIVIYSPITCTIISLFRAPSSPEKIFDVHRSIFPSATERFARAQKKILAMAVTVGTVVGAHHFELEQIVRIALVVGTSCRAISKILQEQTFFIDGARLA
jgi:hypothetical protein